MIMTSAMLVAGLILLFVGGEALVRGAVALASRFGLSPFVIGVTVVGFGTSTPELLVSVQAALDGAPDIAIGNVVGSNIANILLILGVSAVIAPVALKWRTFRLDLAVMVAVALVLVALGWSGFVDRWTGVAMLVALAAYLFWVIRYGSEDAAPDIPAAPAGWLLIIILLVGGLGGLMLGASWLVSSATTFARVFGLSEAVIGLTIVAVGTSLPELATSIIAAFRKQSEVAVGNVIGSNIFNVMAILGASAVVTPLTIAPQLAGSDIPLVLGLSIALTALIALTGGLWRWAGAAMLAGYAVYIGSLL